MSDKDILDINLNLDIIIERLEVLENHVKSMVETDTSNQDRIIVLEKKVKTLDLEKKLKIDYVLKMNQLEKNDKTHQAMHDRAFKQIAELKEVLNEVAQYRIGWETICSIGIPISIQEIIKEYEGRLK